MGCGCRGSKNNFNNSRSRANLQSPRKPFVGPQQDLSIGPNPNANFLSASQQQAASAEDRRRIQRLNQDAIRRGLNR